MRHQKYNLHPKEIGRDLVARSVCSVPVHEFLHLLGMKLMLSLL